MPLVRHLLIILSWDRGFYAEKAANAWHSWDRGCKGGCGVDSGAAQSSQTHINAPTWLHVDLIFKGHRFAHADRE